MGADLSRPEFQKFAHSSLSEAVKDEEFGDLVASLVQTLPPESKQALGSLVLNNYSASNPSQKESQVAELPSDANGPLSNDGLTSNPSQNGPRITELPSDANGPLSNDSSASNPSQNGSQVAELPSDVNGPLSNHSSASNTPQRELQIVKILKDTRFQCLLKITPEQLCINPKIRRQYVAWTGNWTLLFTIPTVQLQPQGNTIAHSQPQGNTTAHSQPQGDFIIHLQPRETIGANLGALYNATVLVEQNALIDSIRWRFLMVFYDGLREMVRDTEALAVLVSSSTGIRLEEVKDKIEGWVSDGRRWRALAQSLSWGSLFLLPESLSNDLWLRLPLSGHNREAAVDKLKLLGIVENARSKKVDDLGADKLSADELGVTIKDGLLEPFKDIAKSIYHQTTEAVNALKRKRRSIANKRHRSGIARHNTSSTAPVVAQGTSLRVEMTRPSDESHHLADYSSAPHQGGPYDFLNPQLAPNPLIANQNFQGGPYDFLNPQLAPSPLIADQDFQGGPYDFLNPQLAPNPLLADRDFPGGPYDFLNPLPAPNSLLVNQGQHSELPGITLADGDLPISYGNSGPAMNNHVDPYRTDYYTEYNGASNPQISAIANALTVTSSTNFNCV